VAGGDAVKWSQQVLAEPMPIKYNLKSLCDAMEGKAKTGCQKAQTATEYCTKRLKNNRHDLESCDDAGDYQCSWDMDCISGHVCVENKCLSGAMPIVFRANPSLCLEAASPIRLNTCNGSPQQKWIFNSAEGKDYMQIYWMGDTNACLDGGKMSNGEALHTSHCNGGLSQTWVRDVKTGSIYLPNAPSGNSCVDAGTGIKAGKNIQMWQCNILPQQQFDISAPKDAEASIVV